MLFLPQDSYELVIAVLMNYNVAMLVHVTYRKHRVNN